MAGPYTFGSQMGGDDPESDSLGQLLTYGANSDEETTGQPNSQPNVKSDASAPIAPAAHVQAVTANRSVPAATKPAAAATTLPSMASMAPVAPVIDRDPQEALYAQKAKDEVVSNVSPKWWERLAGGLTAGAMAFGHMPGAVEAGQAVTNRGQIAAEQQRQGRLAADNAGLQAWQDGLNQQQQDFQNRSTAYRNQQEGARTDQLNADRAAQEQQRLQAVAPGSEAPDDPKNPLGTWHATTVGGKPVALQGPPDKWAKSPAGIAAQRDAAVTRLGLTGDDAKYYRANGKLREPSPTTNIRIPSEGVQSLNEARAAWQRENPGKKPTLSDLRAIRAAADGRADNTGTTDDQAQAIVADATGKKQAFADRWVRKTNGSGDYYSLDGKPDLTAKEFQNKIDQFRVDANTKLARKGYQIDSQGNMVRLGQPQSAASPAVAAAPAGNTPQAARQPAIPNGAVQVKDPRGGIHTFPNQAAADRFKKLARIK